MAWYMVFLYVFLGFVALAIAAFVVLFSIYHIKRAIKVRNFKKCFDSQPETDPDLKNFHKKTKVWDKLRTLASVLSACYISETEILNRMKLGVGLYDSQREELINTRDAINSAEHNFFAAVQAANRLGYEVSGNYKDYIV